MNSLILQKQEEVIALAQFDIKDAVLKKCLLKEDETVITVPDGVTTIGKDALCGLQSVIAVTLPTIRRALQGRQATRRGAGHRTGRQGQGAHRLEGSVSKSVSKSFYKNRDL